MVEPERRGALIGLNLASRREDVLRAVMEGITMNLGIIVNIFRRHVPIEAVTVIGGGAKSAVWRQIMADVYGCRVESLNYLEEATSMGAAVIGGVAVGLFKDFDVIDRFIKVDHVSQPNPVNQAALRPAFRGAGKIVSRLGGRLRRPCETGMNIVGWDKLASSAGPP